MEIVRVYTGNYFLKSQGFSVKFDGVVAAISWLILSRYNNAISKNSNAKTIILLVLYVWLKLNMAIISYIKSLPVRSAECLQFDFSAVFNNRFERLNQMRTVVGQ